jgi:lactate permease
MPVRDATVFMVIAAALPVAAVLVAMVWLRWSGTRAGWAGALVATALALALFGADALILAVACWKAVILSFDVLYIVWAALLLYNIVEETGAIRSIGVGVANLTQDHIMQLMILGFAFSSFLQGVAGFGVPVAVVAPVLVGLGFPPMQAALVPLVGHAWSVTMGTLSSSFQALVTVTGYPGHVLGPWSAGFLGIACLLTGFAVAHIHAGFRPIRRCFGAILVLGLSMAAVQFGLVYFEYFMLASFVAGMVGLGVSMVGARLAQAVPRSYGGLLPNWPAPEGRRTVHRHLTLQPSVGGMGFHLGFAAYYAVIAIVMAATLIPGVPAALDVVRFGIPFPRTATSLGFVTHASTQSVSLLRHAGTYLILAAVVASVIYRAAGHFASGGWGLVVRRTVKQAIPTTWAVLLMVVMAMIMSYAGMTRLLAHGLIAVAGHAFPIVSPFIGLLGCFVTGSNTNANVLFGALQRDVAILLRENPALMAALQTTGAALGSMIAPAKVLVVCATSGLQGKEGEVMRIALKYCLPMTLFVGVLGWLVTVLM